MADYNKLSEALRRIVQAPENNLMILHGFVAKYTSGNKGAVGTIDFISMDGTVRIPEIPINAIPGLTKGQVIVPTIKSDVTVLWAVPETPLYYPSLISTPTTLSQPKR